MFKSIGDEISSVFGRDPAVRSRLEVALCYPGFHAILFYRVAHWLWQRDIKLLGRFVSHLGRFSPVSKSIPAQRLAGGSLSTMAWVS
jgi:serine O-acetyltransferase